MSGRTPSSLALASASPRRKELLERAGFSVQIIPASVNEDPIAGESPAAYTQRLACDKAVAVARTLGTGWATGTRTPPARWVLGADTVVAIDGALLGKPADLAEAREMLARLSGREHQVVTGFSLLDLQRDDAGLRAVTTAVRFKVLSDRQIDHYLATGESMDKAGAYAIQGVGTYMVQAIAGSYTNVVGLPVCEVMTMMEEMGAHDILPY